MLIRDKYILKIVMKKYRNNNTSSNEMKNKAKNNTLSKQFQNPIERNGGKIDPVNAQTSWFGTGTSV